MFDSPRQIIDGEHGQWEIAVARHRDAPTFSFDVIVPAEIVGEPTVMGSALVFCNMTRADLEEHVKRCQAALAEAPDEATCRPVKTEPIGDWYALDVTGPQSEGQGMTMLAAMFAAMVNGQVVVIGGEAGMPGPAIRIPGWIVPADALALLTVAELLVVSPVAVNVPASKTSRVDRARTCLTWPLTTAATL
jgi:hypothetical protein